MSNPLMGMMGGMPGGNGPFGMIQRMMGMMQNTQNPGAMLQNMAQSNPNIKKAMEMCRNRYAWCKIRIHGMNPLTMAMSFRKTDEIEQLLETFAEKNIFQFPEDEEVE